ncbi:MAG: glycosyltransferase family 1 protein [Planctomycetota bacterium]
MNIGLDARSIFSPRPRGTGRNLLDAYRLIPALRPDWRFVLYHQHERDQCPHANAAVPRWPTNVRLRRLDIPGDRLGAWLQIRLPLAAWRDGLDLLHLPANTAPIYCPVPTVVTVHDLAPLKVPDEASPRQRRQFRRGIQRALRSAAHIITPSQATCDELCADFDVDSEHIAIIPWAPDNSLLTESNPAALTTVRDHYGLNRPWLLHFSGRARRKNVAGVIAALRLLPPEIRATYQTVFVGCGTVSERAHLQDQVIQAGIADDCRILGFVPHEEVSALLRGAHALLIPSLHEGFGLPILDAFTCRVPVLASQCSSLPEVAGDAALYCDPTAPPSIAAGITRIVRDDVRRDLIRRGAERVSQFTWERTARQMCEVYQRCRVHKRAAKTCEA